jgi:hypothetical protein
MDRFCTPTVLQVLRRWRCPRRREKQPAGVSLRSVQRILEAHQLAPHRIRTFKLSNDPKFAEKLKDIVGLYVDPPAHAVVLSVEEKSQIQALDRTQPGLPMKPGRADTMTHDYKRHGTTTLFAALNILDGTVIGHHADDWGRAESALSRLDFLCVEITEAAPPSFCIFPEDDLRLPFYPCALRIPRLTFLPDQSRISCLDRAPRRTSARLEAVPGAARPERGLAHSGHCVLQLQEHRLRERFGSSPIRLISLGIFRPGPIRGGLMICGSRCHQAN